MKRYRSLIFLLSWPVLAFPGGCDVFFEEIWGDMLSPVGLDGERYFYEHYANLNFFGESLSSIWSLDLNTGESRRIAEARVRYRLQASGDYFIFTESDEESLFGVQISTGETFTIIEDFGFPAGSCKLDGSSVAFLTSEHKLAIYDLDSREIAQTIDVPENAVRLEAFKNNQALIGRRTISQDFDGYMVSEFLGFLLVDLASNEVTELPVTPDGWVPTFYFAGLSDEWIALSGRRSSFDLSTEIITAEVLVFNIPTLTWRSLVVYQNSQTGTRLPSVVEANVLGMSDTHVLVYQVTGVAAYQIDLIELETGETTVIRRGGLELILTSGGDSERLHGDQVFWIEKPANTLVIYDIPSGTRRTITLDYPGRE